MTGTLIVAWTALVTCAVCMVPGFALLRLVAVDHVVPRLARPAAWLAGTIAMSALLLLPVLAIGLPLWLFALALLAATAWLVRQARLRDDGAAASAARGRGAERRGEDDADAIADADEHAREREQARRRAVRRRRERLGIGLLLAIPVLVVAVVAIVDGPHVRSDTYWHVALVEKLQSLGRLTPGSIAFEASSPGNSGYPLPAWHALLAVATLVPGVDAWSVAWFVPVWLGVVAMLAWGAMAASVTGDRHADIAGAWVFAGVVVLGFGPYFHATRYLSYPGQVAILVLLPLVVVAMVGVLGARTRGGRRRAVAVAAIATALVGVLHANYVLYPCLYAAGTLLLLALARRVRWRDAIDLGIVVGAAAATVALQAPWITRDENFQRGTSTPLGEPTAWLRHRDVLTGSEERFHVAVGTLATQPLLVLGAAAIPALLWLRRGRPGPWIVAGGAVAMVLVAVSASVVMAFDALGTVTPLTRLDRVYPAAIGILAAALALPVALEGWTASLSRRLSVLVVPSVFAAISLLAGGLDAARDLDRPGTMSSFLEARWVGGLDPSGLPRLVIVIATILAVVAAIRIGMDERIAAARRARRARRGARDEQAREQPPSPAMLARRHAVTLAACAALVIGLLPASVDRLADLHKPEAYDSAGDRGDAESALHVYPSDVREALDELPEGATVLAAFDDARRIASLVPVQVVDEGLARAIEADEPPSDPLAYLDQLVEEQDVDYLAGSIDDATFGVLLAAADRDPDRYEQVLDEPLAIYRVRGGG